MSFNSGIIPGIACGLLLVSGCVGADRTALPASVANRLPAPTIKNTEQFWVLDSGWHTGLILSRAELGPTLSHLLQPAADAQYFMFGWGNRKFYMAPSPTLGMDIEALFPSKSAMLIANCENPPRECYTSAVRFHTVKVSAEGLANLNNYLVQSLQTGARGELQALGPGPDADSEFYASGLPYDAFHTCNTWTAEALHVAGLPVDYHGVIFTGQLWRQLESSAQVGAISIAIPKIPAQAANR